MDARCPLCTAVFQTDRTGVQFCPNCGQQVNVADTSGAGAPPPPPPPRPGSAGPNFGIPPSVPPPAPGGGGPREPTPWERRGEIGFFGAFFGTLKEICFSPGEFFGRARTNEPVWDAIIFSWLCTAIWFVCSIPFSLGGANRASLRYYERIMNQLPNIPPEVRKEYERRLAEAMNETAGAAIGKLFLTMLAVMALILLWAVLVHLFALMTGASKNGVGATIRATCYGFAPMVLGFIPCLNIVVMIYAVVVSIIGLSKLQETTGGRAAGAYLLPTFIFCCCCCAGLVMAAVGMAGAMGKMGQ